MKKVGMIEKTVIAIYMLVVIALISPWFYHIAYCFKNEKYILLVAGAILLPIGWVHGIGAFFGWWS